MLAMSEPSASRCLDGDFVFRILDDLSMVSTPYHTISADFYHAYIHREMTMRYREMIFSSHFFL